MKTTAIEPGKDSWRIEELESMDPLQAAKISLAMDAARQILDKLSKDVSK